MARVHLTRTTNRFRRTMNGAWMPGGSDRHTWSVDEEDLKPRRTGLGGLVRFSIGDGLVAEFEDGTTESAYPTVPGSAHEYAPTCFPPNGRLAALLNHGF